MRRQRGGETALVVGGEGSYTSRMPHFLVATAASQRRLTEVGLLIGGLGAVAIIVGGLLGLRQSGNGDTGRNERLAYIVGALLIGVCFLLQIIGIRSA